MSFLKMLENRDSFDVIGAEAVMVNACVTASSDR